MGNSIQKPYKKKTKKNGGHLETNNRKIVYSIGIWKNPWLVPHRLSTLHTFPSNHHLLLEAWGLTATHTPCMSMAAFVTLVAAQHTQNRHQALRLGE